MTLEPTESYSRDDLDEYAAILRTIVEEAYADPDRVHGAPYASTVHRIDHESLDDPERWAVTWRAYRRKYGVGPAGPGRGVRGRVSRSAGPHRAEDGAAGPGAAGPPRAGPPSARVPRLGIVVNPIAGIGGAVGLKGSDGPDTVRRALELGAVPHANDRAALALARLVAAWPPGRELPRVLAGAGSMGESAAIRAGLSPEVVGGRPRGVDMESTADDATATTADDTRAVVAAMAAAGADLILFAGGDGTARDVAAALGTVGGAAARIPVLGVPAGVKIESAVFATSPATAGDLAATFLASTPKGRRVAAREVVDLDEEAYRRGEIAPRLYGELPVPADDRRVQARKEPTPASDAAATAAIAADLATSLPAGVPCVLGPGSTLRVVAEHLGVGKTLVGVDVVLLDADRRTRVLVADARGAQLDDLAAGGGLLVVVVTPIGGQGFLFGRGNQQIGAAVVARALSASDRDGVVVVATPAKLAALRGRPLLVDTGDPAVDAMFRGHIGVVTGHRERTMYPVRPAWESLR